LVFGKTKGPNVLSRTNIRWVLCFLFFPNWLLLARRRMLYNESVLKRKHHAGLTALMSLAGLIILMTVTNPVDNVIYTALFFGLALVFMVSLGYFVIRLQNGEISHKNRYRIVSLSLVLLILLMFRSAQSLSWVDGIILVLIGFGLIFYISKRSA
jgi:inner membrane protein involved in colicin E2 resistance